MLHDRNKHKRASMAHDTMLLSPWIFRPEVRYCFNHFDTSGVALAQQAKTRLNGALVFLMLCLARLCHLYLLHHCLPHSRAGDGAPHGPPSPAPPRSPRDCRACRLSSTFSRMVEPAPPPVRPWREVKSRRGAPKRMNTQGFACPNHQCPYSGITDAHVHAPSWRWHAWSC
jgi:hypothetical protein